LKDPVTPLDNKEASFCALGTALGWPAQTITGVLDQLQTAGLVSRSPHPSDRRSTMAELTPAGREAIDRICPPLIDIEQDCMSALGSAEQTQLTDLLTRVQEQIARRRSAATTNAQ
jgi:DNA-binding MarR family transcriptional regulator